MKIVFITWLLLAIGYLNYLFNQEFFFLILHYVGVNMHTFSPLMGLDFVITLCGRNFLQPILHCHKFWELSHDFYKNLICLFCLYEHMGALWALCENYDSFHSMGEIWSFISTNFKNITFDISFHEIWKTFIIDFYPASIKSKSSLL